MKIGDFKGVVWSGGQMAMLSHLLRRVLRPRSSGHNTKANVQETVLEGIKTSYLLNFCPFRLKLTNINIFEALKTQYSWIQKPIQEVISRKLPV